MAHQALARRLSLLVVTAVAASSTMLMPSASASTATGASVSALSPTSDGSAPRFSRRSAQRALVRAEAALRPVVGAHSTPGSGEHHDATLALRALDLRQAQLSVDDHRRASRLLARPASNATVENNAVVVHYSSTSASLADAEATLAVVTQVRNTYLAAGYRAPKSDGTLGGDGRFDVYLANLSASGAYGYCSSDEALSNASGRTDRWAFCVLDNTYADFPGTPAQVRQVTIAHEYFHAVQYAYDSLEDGWFMEGTAVWAEDQVFDEVNDNLQYARFSPLANPRYSLDISAQNNFRQYGAWLWFRWLTERFPESQGTMPTLVRDFWEAVDSTGGNSTAVYSLRAVAQVLKRRGIRLTKAFALFADANRRPTAFYSEAAENGYPVAPARTVKLSARGASSLAVRLNHLASQTTRFVPTKVAARKARLRLALDLGEKKTGSAVVVSTYLRSGKVKTKYVKLNRRGNGVVSTPFSSDRVTAIEATMVNASQRFTQCYRYSLKYSCSGKPTDQKVLEQIRAAVLR